ncbi:hypothetical protein JXA12_00875 [Candidatus Woesearchaeota archaeon]|nr:hypothetical protein [Candidatus Woesearchaeota archaeon]
MSIAIIREGVRMYRRHLHVKNKYFKRFTGDATSICHAILAQLWNGRYLRTDLGNYPQFWARDFGMTLPALLKLGMREESRATLAYALNRYEEAGRITTHLTPAGKPISFPQAYSPDSAAYLLRSVRILGDEKLLKKHKGFLQRETRRFAEEALGKDGRVKRKKHLGGMRDHAIRNASCYDTVMAAIMQQECALLGLRYKHAKTDYKKVLINDYWTGTHFKDDVTNDTLTADANIYPFWLGIINDQEKLRQAVRSMQLAGLDKPFPIKYVKHREEQGKSIWQNLFVKDWEADSVWPMSGLPYIDLVAKVDEERARKHVRQYERLIRKHGTFLEVYDREGKPYTSRFFSTGEGMIWCAQWLMQREKWG